MMGGEEKFNYQLLEEYDKVSRSSTSMFSPSTTLYTVVASLVLSVLYIGMWSVSEDCKVEIFKVLFCVK